MPGEMSGSRGGGGSGMAGGGGAPAGTAAPPPIPSNARKLVHSLKEVVTGFGDDEIYAMLKECNMDPNETAQRLMTQDTFHEVKRRRDKKKEAAASNKEVFDNRSRGTGAYRGGRGGGRGGSITRYTSSDSNGRGKALPPKENGHHVPSSAPAPSVTDSKPPPPQHSIYSGSSISAGGSPALSNGTSYPTTVPATQGSWSKMAGHATMADMLKSTTNASQHHPPANVLTGQQFSYSSSDPVHHPFSDQRPSGNVHAKIGILGNPRPIGDRTTAPGGLPSQSQPLDDPGQPVSPTREPAKSHEAVAAVSSSETLRQTSGYRAAALGNGRPSYQQQPAATVNKTAGINLEWKPKLVTQETTGLDSAATESFESVTVPAISESEVLAVAAKFQNLSPRDERQQVIMPNNFQAQGDLGLSFGSFGEGLGSSLPSGFSTEDGLEISASSQTSVQAKDILHEQSPSAADVVAQDEDPVHRQDEMPAAQRDNLSPNTTPSIPVSYTSQTDISKLRTAQQAQQQYSYLQSPPSYSSGLSQIPSSQHVFESQDSHLQELSSASTALKQQQYADSGASFYSPSPSFRPSADGDARFAQYLPAAGKYTNGPVAMSGQQHLPVHEVTNSTTLSSSSAVSQAPQSGNTHSMPTAAQQPVPVHAYPAQPTGVPVGHFGNVFGYQYPGYTFMPSPYQHSYTTNYPQPPVSSYSPSNYTPAGVAAMKYTTLPQYKPGSATANTPISAGSYGGYGTASSMYAANPTPSATNTPGYDDASGAYKDSNLYVHGPQQGDGARLWQLSSDVAAQATSFYALSGQSQHTSYTQPSSHTHPMAGYTSLYHHPSQPGPAGSAHQMIQQPQTLSGAAGSTQVGATNYHQQLQQRNWTAY